MKNPKLLDIGSVFNRLTIIAIKPNLKSLVRCSCGTEKILENSAIRRGRSKSCGCLQREVASRQGKASATHGLSKSRVFNSYNAMKNRCYYKKNKDYSNYGGRGITVCDRWLESFENFYADMGHPPQGMTLDRIDNNGNYEPSNCRWATNAMQGMNQRQVILIKFDNEIISLSEASRRINRSASVPWAMAKRLDISFQECIDYLRTPEAVKLRLRKFNIKVTPV